MLLISLDNTQRACPGPLAVLLLLVFSVVLIVVLERFSPYLLVAGAAVEAQWHLD